MIKGWQIDATWLPGHEGFAPNEMADKVAKESAASAQGVHYPCDRRLIINQLRERVIHNWQFRYDNTCAQHNFYSICPKVNKWFMPKIGGMKLVGQLVSGHNKLNVCQVHFNSNVRDDKCLCGIRESADHYMFYCERYTLLRYNLCQKMNLITGKNFTDLHQFGWRTIAGQDELFSQDTRCEILVEVIKYLVQSKRFATRT